jgi:hypothetical protein
LVTLAKDEDERVREAVAGNPNYSEGVQRSG